MGGWNKNHEVSLPSPEPCLGLSTWSIDSECSFILPTLPRLCFVYKTIWSPGHRKGRECHVGTGTDFSFCWSWWHRPFPREVYVILLSWKTFIWSLSRLCGYRRNRLWNQECNHDQRLSLGFQGGISNPPIQIRKSESSTWISKMVKFSDFPTQKSLLL